MLKMERRLVKIGEAAAMIGSTPATLRKWDATGELLAARKTRGGTRYYAVSDLLKLNDNDAPTVCYARVSSHDQKGDMVRQVEMLETYCAAKGWRQSSAISVPDEPSQETGLEMILRRRTHGWC